MGAHYHIIVAKPGYLQETPAHRKDPSYDPEDKDQKVRRVVRFLGAKGLKVFCPEDRETRMRRGKRVEKRNPVFGRYVAVQGDPYKALRCEGVARVLTSQGKFATVSESELEPFIRPVNEKPISRTVKDFPKGSLARVKSGLLEGYQGKVLRVDPSAEQVRLDLVGAIARTWIDARDLERV